MAVLAGTSEQQDDQGTSIPLKEINETPLQTSAEDLQRASLQKSPLETLQEDPKDTQTEEEKADSGQRAEESADEESEEDNANDGLTAGTESNANSSERDGIEVVDLDEDEEDQEHEANEGDGNATNEPLEVETNVVPLRVELPQSSLSRMTDEELALLRRNDPIGYMKAKLAQRDVPLARAGTSSTSYPLPTDERIVLLNKIRKTILNVDIFEVLKQDSTACYTMKELLTKVNLSTCSLPVSTLLFDLQNLLDNVTGYLLQDESAAKKVQEKRIAMDAAYEQASKLSQEAEDQAMHLKQAKTDYEARAESILIWERQILELQQKVKEAKEQQLAFETNPAGNQFEELLNRGLAEMETAEQLKGEVATLEGARRFAQQKLESFRSTFNRLKNNSYF